MDQVADELDQLVDRAVKGERPALDALLARVHPLVVRFCRARLADGHRSSSTADDVAQEVCMAIMNALPAYRREARPFLAFVYGIASHKVVDAHRAAARSPMHSVADVPELPTSEPDPEQAAVDAAVAHTVTCMMDVLPSQQRDILTLRVAVGLSADETAVALGMTAGAVRVAQHRALAKLRKVIETDHDLSEQLS